MDLGWGDVSILVLIHLSVGFDTVEHGTVWTDCRI